MDIIDVLLSKSLAEQASEQADNNKVNKSGDTMTGQLTVESTVKSDNVETEKLTVTATNSTEDTKVEPLKVRDDRVDILKTTTKQRDGSTHAQSVAYFQKNQNGSNEIEINASIDAKGKISNDSTIETGYGIKILHNGSFSIGGVLVTLAEGSLTFGKETGNEISRVYSAGTNIGLEGNAGNSVNLNQNGGIDINGVGNSDSSSIIVRYNGNENFSAGTEGIKIRGQEGLSLEGNVTDDVWKLCGDLKFTDPQLHNTLPGDVTEEETTWLGNNTLQNQVLELKRTDKTIEDSITELQSGKQDKPTITTATETTATIQPNTIYEYGEVAELNLTLADTVGSYEVVFESGETATVLSLTSTKSLLWHNEPVVLANKVYVLSVEVGTTYARAVLSYAEPVS